MRRLHIAETARRTALEAVVDDIIAGRVDVLDWSRAMAEKLKVVPNQVQMSTVKIKRSLLTRARYLAAERGEKVSVFLSGILREPIEREWAKILRKKAGDKAQ